MARRKADTVDNPKAVDLWNLAAADSDGYAKDFATAIIVAHPGVIPPVLLAQHATELRRTIATAFAAGSRHGQAITRRQLDAAEASVRRSRAIPFGGSDPDDLDAFRTAFLAAASDDAKRGGK